MCEKSGRIDVDTENFPIEMFPKLYVAFYYLLAHCSGCCLQFHS